MTKAGVHQPATQHQHQQQQHESHQSSHHSPQYSAPSPTPTSGGLSRYLKLEKLGEGNYGCVYKARDKVTGSLVALKKIKLDDNDDGVPSTAIREVAILQDIIHPSIVKLEQVILEKGQLYLVFEFLDLDLRRYLDNIYASNPHSHHSYSSSSSSTVKPKEPVKGLPMALVKSYTYQLLLGIEFMHSHRHLHRDIKPQNLLIDRTGRMQIADLGLARAFSTPMPPVTHEVATLWYRPPEILLGSKPYSSPIDLWAVGCCMAEMISLYPSFPGDSEIDTLFKIFQCVGTPTKETWPEVVNCPDWHPTFPNWKQTDDQTFLKCLRIEPEHNLDADGINLLRSFFICNPKERISARQALQHPWFTKSNLHSLSEKESKKLNAHAKQIAEEATGRAMEKQLRKKEELAKIKRYKYIKRQQQQQQQLGSADGDESHSEADSEQFDEDLPEEEIIAQQQHAAAQHQSHTMQHSHSTSSVSHSHHYMDSSSTSHSHHQQHESEDNYDEEHNSSSSSIESQE